MHKSSLFGLTVPCRNAVCGIYRTPSSGLHRSRSHDGIPSGLTKPETLHNLPKCIQQNCIDGNDVELAWAIGEDIRSKQLYEHLATECLAAPGELWDKTDTGYSSSEDLSTRDSSVERDDEIDIITDESEDACSVRNMDVSGAVNRNYPMEAILTNAVAIMNESNFAPSVKNNGSTMCSILQVSALEGQEELSNAKDTCKHDFGGVHESNDDTSSSSSSIEIISDSEGKKPSLSPRADKNVRL